MRDVTPPEMSANTFPYTFRFDEWWYTPPGVGPLMRLCLTTRFDPLPKYMDEPPSPVVRGPDRTFRSNTPCVCSSPLDMKQNLFPLLVLSRVQW